ncbi:MAG: GGDEF domain-containing protein [Alphaproteobacteria bacterium]|nr:GGDEF domain-containing protein [Alphaproteobacteria bacterium]
MDNRDSAARKQTPTEQPLEKRKLLARHAFLNAHRITPLDDPAFQNLSEDQHRATMDRAGTKIKEMLYVNTLKLSQPSSKSQGNERFRQFTDQAGFLLPYAQGEERYLLQAFKGISAKANEHRKETREANKNQLIDPLTHTLNRQGFARALKFEIADMIRRQNRSLALVNIDLDGFKDLNDNFGHPEGDKALIKVASLFKHGLRKTDVVAHPSGDEFALLLTYDSKEYSKSTTHQFIEEDIRKKIKNLMSGFVLWKNNSPFPLTASIGMAFFGPETFNQETTKQEIDAIIAEKTQIADEKMYKDKKGKPIRLLAAKEHALKAGPPSTSAPESEPRLEP